MKFKHKPTVIDAFRFDGENIVWPLCYTADEPNKAFVNTLEGPLHVSAGDWVITGVDGEHYSIKPDIFVKTYDLDDSEIEKLKRDIMLGGSK